MAFSSRGVRQSQLRYRYVDSPAGGVDIRISKEGYFRDIMNSFRISSVTRLSPPGSPGPQFSPSATKEKSYCACLVENLKVSELWDLAFKQFKNDIGRESLVVDSVACDANPDAALARFYSCIEEYKLELAQKHAVPPLIDEKSVLLLLVLMSQQTALGLPLELLRNHFACESASSGDYKLNVGELPHGTAESTLMTVNISRTLVEVAGGSPLRIPRRACSPTPPTRPGIKVILQKRLRLFVVDVLSDVTVAQLLATISCDVTTPGGEATLTWDVLPLSAEEHEQLSALHTLRRSRCRTPLEELSQRSELNSLYF